MTTKSAAVTNYVALVSVSVTSAGLITPAENSGTNIHGNGVLVMSDVFGATPSNIACKLLIAGRVEGVSGVSLPMLVRALTYRNEALKVVVGKAISGGLEGVMQLPIENCRDAATGS